MMLTALYYKEHNRIAGRCVYLNYNTLSVKRIKDMFIIINSFCHFIGELKQRLTNHLNDKTKEEQDEFLFQVSLIPSNVDC